MTDFTKVRANLERRGFQVSCFAAAQEAAYLRGVHPAVGPGAQAQLPLVGPQLPQHRAAVHALNDPRQLAEILGVVLRCAHPLHQRPGGGGAHPEPGKSGTGRINPKTCR